MLSLLLKDLKPAEAQNFLQHAIAPRPICFASTVDKEGKVNLSPFSFFNMFSSNPPVIVFSPARRVRDNSTKHTLQNIEEVPEVVVNIVTYDMVQQVSLSSCEFPKGVDEFSKVGFHKIPSEIVRPPRVKESPVQLECKVLEVKSLGTGGGAGNLIIAEIILMHISKRILDDSGKIDQKKLELVARLGGNWYARVNESNLFEVEKPNLKLGIGVDALPDHIRNSNILTGNDLGKLANVDCLPGVNPAFADDRVKQIFQYYNLQPEEMERELHLYAKELLERGEVERAWQTLLAV
jgi:flavin reductase (DIM6/NTAB) family NADH-FMN oxidoreductase RutF